MLFGERNNHDLFTSIQTNISFGHDRFNPSINARSFDGNIDEVAFFNTALSEDSVAAIYNNGTPIDLRTDSGGYTQSQSASLQAYWKLDGDYLDRSGNGYHLTAVGSPTFSFNIPGGDNIVRAWNFSSNSLEPYIGSTEMSFVSSTGDYND